MKWSKWRNNMKIKYIPKSYYKEPERDSKRKVKWWNNMNRGKFTRGEHRINPLIL